MKFRYWLTSFLSEPNGGLEYYTKGSSRRVMELAVVWCFIASYIKTVVLTSSLPDVPWGWVFLLAGILGLKSYDAYVKKSNGSSSDPSSSKTQSTVTPQTDSK